MNISYDVLTRAFLSKITEFDFMRLQECTSQAMIDGYIRTALYRFDKVCKYDLKRTEGDERFLTADIAEEDVDEIVDILSEGMIAEWLKPYVYKAENLENVLNTTDYTSYSPAELLLRITGVYKMAKEEFDKMIKDYSYDHGDLSDLHT